MNAAELQNLISQTDSYLAEDGAGYGTLELLDCRSDRLAEDIADAEKHGDDSVCLKVPSGSEQSIPLELAKAYRAGRIG